jgi:uncharacterized protein (TIGR03546 family)
MSLLLLLRKLARILRAGSAPRQVGLGLFFGAMAGMPPFNPLSVIWILLFLLLDANIGGFFIALGLGKALALGFAPALHSLGGSILEDESLRGPLAWFLDLPVVSISGLDGYLAFGATVAAVALGVVLFLVALVVVNPLRRFVDAALTRPGILRKVSENKVVSFVGRFLFGKKKDAAKIRIVRKSFAVPMVLFLALVAGFWWLFGDELIRKGMELAASRTTGKEVTLRKASLAFLAGSFGMEEMKVREARVAEDSDIAEGEKIAFAMNPWKLLDRQVFVSTATVENLTVHPDAKTTEGMPSPAPSPPPGKPADLESVFGWVKAHEEQIRWALDTIGGAIEKAGAPPDPGSPFLQGRAAWVSAQRSAPFFVLGEAGIKNLRLDWKEQKASVTRLQTFDFLVRGLSSSPKLHGLPVEIETRARLDSLDLGLLATFDVREGAEHGYGLQASMSADSFGFARSLGLTSGRDLTAKLGFRIDPSSGRLAQALCEGSFTADGLSQVKFSLTGGDVSSFDVQLTGLRPAGMDGIQKPEDIHLSDGVLDLGVRLSLARGGGLDGSLAVVGRGLKLSPGGRSTLAGLPAADVCRGLEALTTKQPLSVTFNLSGTTSKPVVGVDDSGLAAVLTQVQAGLVMLGEQRLAQEIDKRLGPLEEKLGGEVARRKKELEEKLGKGVGEALGDRVGEVLGVDKVGEKVGEDVKEKAGSLLEGIFGGKKKKEPPKKEQPPPQSN